jgi:hypothetical protein
MQLELQKVTAPAAGFGEGVNGLQPIACRVDGLRPIASRVNGTASSVRASIAVLP